MGTPDYVFEASFEICNKVGGIYTVIKTKAPQMVSKYGDNYITIGYWQADHAIIELEPDVIPKKFEKAFKTLEGKGVKCYFGRWDIAGSPQTILIDASGLNENLDAIKSGLWTDFGVDSMRSDAWFHDPLKWSWAVGLLIEQILVSPDFKSKKVVGHFHEWLSGFALLYLKRKNLPIATVFTTHATILGRSISGSGKDLYAIVNEGLKRGEIATVDLSRAHRCEDKHTTEVACAKNADVFTTVSEITSKEASFILGRSAEVLVFNGLTMDKYGELEDMTVKRKHYRAQMQDFLRSYFGRYYDIDLDNVRSAFISGRYEFHNKGLDIFCDALGRLNKLMKEKGTKKDFVAFIFVPSGTAGENLEVLKNKALYEEIKDHVDDMLDSIKESIVKSIASGEKPDNIISAEARQNIKKLSAHFRDKKGGKPPLCAFNLSYDVNSDPVINSLKANGLENRKEDKVKVIFYPAYLSSADSLISMEYGQATLTCDVGVFPSYYEPWGYTPLETAAQGSLTVTSDLAGFGRFVKGMGPGVKVLKMEGQVYSDIVEELTQYLFQLVNMPGKELSKARMSAKDIASNADWNNLAENYFKAHTLALIKHKS